MAVSKTLLEIANAVTNELGLPQLTSVIGSLDATARQILALANRTGDELYQTQQWTALQNYTITNIETPVYIGDGVTVSGSTDLVITTTAGITANYFAVTGTQIPTAARVTAVSGDGITLTMDEPSTYSGTSSVVVVRDTFDIPVDFQWFLNRTMWDRTNHWELIGPMSPQADEWQRSGIVSVGPRKRWRQVGLPQTCWRIWPPPSATPDYPSTLVFEYVSDYWVKAADGTLKGSFTADTDTTVIDPQGMILGIKWRLWQAKGFDYGAYQAEYNDYVSRLAARDGGSPDLWLGKRRLRDDYLITSGNIQDGNWPSN